MSKLKKKESRKNKQNILLIITLKLLIILLLILGYFHVNSTFSNEISLLAVSEDSEGEINSGSIINLALKIKSGTGKIFVNLNTIEEVDTQISIINSQKIACNLFDLDCSSYDFYYEFKGSALILKGPSASSAIAILTAKTLNKIKIENSSVITGSLNSGGIVGNVGGVDTKIKLAIHKGFKKVIIPLFSKYNSSKYQNLVINDNSTIIEEENLMDRNLIEILPVLDIIEAYNEFNGNKFELKTEKIDDIAYLNLMEELGSDLCERSNFLKSNIDFNLIEVNSSKSIYLNSANTSFNSGMDAKSLNNFYSMGSFCYNSNINYRILSELNKNDSKKNIDLKLDELDKEINFKYNEINSVNFKNNIITKNDFYTYLIIIDRVAEAKDLIEDAKKIDENSQEEILKLLSKVKNNSNNSSSSDSMVDNVSKNTSIVDIFNENINNIMLIEENNNLRKNLLYSYAKERFYTIELWEKFISHDGKNIKFSDELIAESCLKINREISIKSELLKNYGIIIFKERLIEQNKYFSDDANKYLCIYEGLENIGRINTVLNAAGINNDEQNDYTQKMIDFTSTRLAINSEGDFPLIPQIYNEYSQDLLRINDTSSAMLYSNFALSYSDLDIYLEKEKNIKGYFNSVISEVFENKIFLGAVLFLLAFIGY